MQYILGLLLLLAIFIYIIRKLFYRSEKKTFIDNAERFAEENQYNKEEHKFFKGESEFDYRGRKVKSERDNEYVGWFSEDESTKN